MFAALSKLLAPARRPARRSTVRTKLSVGQLEDRTMPSSVGGDVFDLDFARMASTSGALKRVSKTLSSKGLSKIPSSGTLVAW